MKLFTSLLLLLAISALAVPQQQGGTSKLSGTAKVARATSSAVAFPSTPVLDDFNRANESPIGAPNWTSDWYTALGSTGCQISTNVLFCAADSSYYSLTTFGPRVEVYNKHSDDTNINTNSFPLLGWRITNPGASPTGYYAEYISGSAYFIIVEVTAGTGTQLGANISYTLTSTECWGVRHDDATIELYADPACDSSWVLIATRTDNTHSGAGYIGIYGGNSHIDDFGGGTMP